MNKAQKFLLNNECDDLRLKDAQKVENWVYVSDVMELYHQEQVKSLTILDVVGRSEQLSPNERPKIVGDFDNNHNDSFRNID